MPELIPVGTEAATSAEFTNTAGSLTTLYLKGSGSGAPPSGASFVLEHKTPAGAFVSIKTLDTSNLPLNLTGVGTFRVRRNTTPFPAGMDRD